MDEFASKQEERLARLLSNAHSISTEAACFEDATYAKQLRVEANHLIANGVTIPVRCEECKSCMFCYPEKQIGKEPTPGWYCKEQKSYRRPDDFCSYGERRNDA